MFQSFKSQYTLLQHTGKCLALSINVNTLITHLKENFNFEQIRM